MPNLTGNPFVDVGFGIIAVRSKKESVDAISDEDASQAVDRHLQQIESIQKLKVLSKIWQNNPLQTDKPQKNRGDAGRYLSLLSSLAKIDTTGIPGSCQICGQSPLFQPANRSWFPLAGGLNDACTISNLGERWLCANCFRAIVMLPVGCRLCSTGPYFIHVADPIWQVEAVRDAVATIDGQIAAKATGPNQLRPRDIDKNLRGRVELLAIVAGSDLWDTSIRGNELPSGGATVIAFDNGGTSARLIQLHLPAKALLFFNTLRVRSGLLDIFVKWLDFCNKSTVKDRESKQDVQNVFFDRICEDIEQLRSISPLLLAIVRSRSKKMSNGKSEMYFTTKEKKVLEIYEDKLLNRQERFSVLEQIASQINAMDESYRESLLKQMANLTTKDAFYKVLVAYTRQHDKYGLKLTVSQLRVIHESPSVEVISLLYLLCIAEKETGND